MASDPSSASIAARGADLAGVRLSQRALAIESAPFCRFGLDGALPRALYESLYASFPEEGDGLLANDEGRLGLRSSESAEAFAAFCRARPAWGALVAHLSSDAFVLDVRRRLAGALGRARGLAGRRRWRNDTGRAPSERRLDYLLLEPVRVTFQLSRMPAGAVVLPHTDAPRKLVSLVLYFADPDWEPGWGGATEYFAAPRGRTPAPTERLPFDALASLGASAFRPNRLVGFVRSPASWHGVRPVTCPPGRARKALLINLKRVKWSKRHNP